MLKKYLEMKQNGLCTKCWHDAKQISWNETKTNCVPNNNVMQNKYLKMKQKRIVYQIMT